MPEQGPARGSGTVCIDCLESSGQDVYNAFRLLSDPEDDIGSMAETFTITYKFTLADSSEEVFELVFDARTIELITEDQAPLPAWTALTLHQCPPCPLEPETHPHCPVAKNLSIAVSRLDRLMSFDRVLVKVINAERQVVHHTSAQEGISSLMGLLIAGSSCPVTHFFKPMARFHLPFANKDETLWRVAATFLLARYFSEGGLEKSGIGLDGLINIYYDVARLNDHMVERVRSATSKDSAVNALVHLDVFAKFLTPPLEDSLDQIKHIFSPFLNPKEPMPS
jgi:hypothetical protein